MSWAKEGVNKLKDLWYKLFVVSNQSGIWRWFYDQQDFDLFTQALAKELEIEFDAIACCPHKPDEWCDCRKPNTGMIKKITQEFDIDLNQSYMIWDKESDIQCGQNAWCKTVFIGSDPQIKSDYQVATILEFANQL